MVLKSSDFRLLGYLKVISYFYALTSMVTAMVKTFINEI